MSSPSIVETTSTKILNANSFSIFGSIAIHALVLGIALPSMSVFSPKEKSAGDRNVGLIELNEIEQSRLPNFSQPSLNVPAYPDLNAPNNTLVNPSSFPASIPDPDSFASLPPPPTSSLPSPPPSISFNNNIPISIPPRSMLPAPPSNALPAPPPQQYNYQTPPNISSPNENKRPNFEPPREAIDPRDLINQRIPTLPSNRTSSEDLNETPQTATSPREWQGAPPGNPAETLREQRIRRLVAESIQGAESLIADKANTTNEEALRNDVNWRTRVGQAKPQEIKIVGNYPRAACMRKLEGQTVYGVMVDNQGRVVNSPYRPYLIKSAGYPILNQQALKEVRTSSFPNQAETSQAYQITVDFKFNEKVCPSLAVAQPEAPRNESEKPLNTPKPSSEIVSPPPVTPRNDAGTEVIKPNQSPSEAGNSQPTSPREATDLTKPDRSPSEAVNTEPTSPREASETTETNTLKKPASEVVSPTPALRKKPETTEPNQPASEDVNSKPTLPRKAPEAMEDAPPKPNRETPAPASFKKPSATRPLGVSAPKKPRRVESESSKTPSEAPKPSRENN